MDIQKEYTIHTHSSALGEMGTHKVTSIAAVRRHISSAATLLGFTLPYSQIYAKAQANLADMTFHLTKTRPGIDDNRTDTLRVNVTVKETQVA